MTSRRVPAERDLVEPGPDRPLTVLVDGEPVTGTAGQTIAGVLLGAGRRQWRTTREGGAPRGVFCGIGVCFDCLVEVNGLRDVRACLRRAQDGDVVTRQDGEAVARQDGEAVARQDGEAVARQDGEAVARQGGRTSGGPAGHGSDEPADRDEEATA